MLVLPHLCKRKLRSRRLTSRSCWTVFRCHFAHLQFGVCPWLRCAAFFLCDGTNYAARPQNFSNRMEKQAATVAVVTPTSARLATVQKKRVAFLSDLPDDVILKCAFFTMLFILIFFCIPVVFFLTSPPSGLSLLTPNCLCAVAQTCKRLRSIASADNLWRPLSLKMWSRLQPQPPQSFKQVQARRYQRY